MSINGSSKLNPEVTNIDLTVRHCATPRWLHYLLHNYLIHKYLLLSKRLFDRTVNMTIK